MFQLNIACINVVSLAWRFARAVVHGHFCLTWGQYARFVVRSESSKRRFYAVLY